MKWATWELEDIITDGWKSKDVDFMFYNNLHPGIVVKTPNKNNVNPFGIPELPSTAYLYGVDKPMVELKEDGWYLTFYDSYITNRAVIERNILGVGWDDVMFYWDPDCVPLVIKQAHIIMNFFRANPAYKKLLKTVGPGKLNYKNFIINLIYPNYKAEWQCEKPVGTFAFTSDDFFINQLENSSTRNWHETLSQYSNLLTDITSNTPFSKYIHCDKGAAKYNVIADCPSYHYYLGPE
jgi:hypothetical protein